MFFFKRVLRVQKTYCSVPLLLPFFEKKMCCGFGILSQLSQGKGKETIVECGIFNEVWSFLKPEAIQIMIEVISFSQKKLSTSFYIFLRACVTRVSCNCRFRCDLRQLRTVFLILICRTHYFVTLKKMGLAFINHLLKISIKIHFTPSLQTTDCQ